MKKKKDENNKKAIKNKKEIIDIDLLDSSIFDSLDEPTEVIVNFDELRPKKK